MDGKQINALQKKLGSVANCCAPYSGVGALFMVSQSLEQITWVHHNDFKWLSKFRYVSANLEMNCEDWFSNSSSLKFFAPIVLGDDNDWKATIFHTGFAGSGSLPRKRVRCNVAVYHFVLIICICPSVRSQFTAKISNDWTAWGTSNIATRNDGLSSQFGIWVTGDDVVQFAGNQLNWQYRSCSITMLKNSYTRSLDQSAKYGNSLYAAAIFVHTLFVSAGSLVR